MIVLYVTLALVFFVEPVSIFNMEKVRKNSPANDKGQLNMANEIKIARVDSLKLFTIVLFYK